MKPPTLGPLIPRNGNALTRVIGRCLLAGFRWKIEGEMHNARKFVIVIAPHTSTWDFFIPLAIMLTLGFRSSWLVAAKYTCWPLGSFMRWLGGIPVDRSASHGLVAQVVQRFNANDKFILSLFPEGTRKKVREWKTGFWHIAAQAGVPIQLVSLDYGKKLATFGPVINPSDTPEADMEQIRMHYRDVTAKHPDAFENKTDTRKS